MIVVPIDGSNQALTALDYAISMANKYDESLLLLNVQRNEELTDQDSEEIISWKRNKEMIGFKLIEKAIAKIDGKVPYEMKVRFGVPSIEITNEAKDIDAHCIVMGSRGNGPIVSAILGSVSYGVLHLSPCPVMVIPDNNNS